MSGLYAYDVRLQSIRIITKYGYGYILCVPLHSLSSSEASILAIKFNTSILVAIPKIIVLIVSLKFADTEKTKTWHDLMYTTITTIKSGVGSQTECYLLTAEK